MRKAIIIGAGPAGLTVAYELLTRTDIVPIIIEAGTQVGGLSRTVDHHGNKIDIGGHRFFSRSQRVIDWWLHFLPLEDGHAGETIRLKYQNSESEYKVDSSRDTSRATLSEPPGSKPAMLVRKRKSRIFYRHKLFDYPLTLNVKLLKDLGVRRTVRTGMSYLRSKISPRKPELTLEDFFINRFGTELYQTFFRDYTEKVWGVPCNKLPASWGQQRVKNLDVTKLLGHAIRSMFTKDKSLDQQDTSTSLIEQFLYPKLGPGQMWETVAAEIRRLGGDIRLNAIVTGIHGTDTGAIESVSVGENDSPDAAQTSLHADFVFSTMPVKQLLENTTGLRIPRRVMEVASSLQYRDFLIVGILVKDLHLKEKDGSSITDNWIYIQDQGVKAGRLQFFHNWSPYMVATPGNKWIGVEYFTNEADAFWKMTDAEIAAQALGEMRTIGVLNHDAVLDSVVVRVKKAYPSYYGGYKDFGVVREFLETIPNFYPIGRNGMHRYNNTDHSMLTAMTTVDNLVNGITDRSNIWEINTEEEYNEEK